MGSSVKSYPIQSQSLFSSYYPELNTPFGVRHSSCPPHNSPSFLHHPKIFVLINLSHQVKRINTLLIMPNYHPILLLTLLLISPTLTDNTIDVDCHQCGTYVCMTFTGAVLRGQDIEMVTTTCQQLGDFPGKITFTCGVGGCSQGCMMTEAWAGRTPYSTCTTTATGKDQVDALNYVYSQQEGDPEYSLTYDWCGCDKKEEGLSVGVIIGIAGGAVVGVAVLAGVGYYCLKKRKGKGEQLLPQRRSINEPKPEKRRSVQQSRPERRSRRDEPAPARSSKEQNRSFMFLQ